MRRIESDTVLKVGFLWAIALFVFAILPYKQDSGGPVFHRMLCLIVAPLLIALFVLILPTKQTGVPTPPIFGGKCRGQIWVKVALMIAVCMLLTVALVSLNDASASHRDESTVGISMSLFVMLVIFAHGIWESIKVLKTLG